MKDWKKLTQDQINTLGISTYDGEVVLIDNGGDHVTNDSFFFNAQEHFSDEEITKMEYFGAFISKPNSLLDRNDLSSK